MVENESSIAVVEQTVINVDKGIQIYGVSLMLCNEEWGGH